MYESEFPLDDSIVYLNHAAVSPWPRRTAAAVREFARENMQRGSLHYEAWLGIEHSLREQLRKLINAESVQEIALLKNTSEALSVVAHGLTWSPGENVVITDQEFPSNRIVWESLQSQGVEVRMAGLAGPTSPEDAVAGLVDKRTRLVSVSSVQYGTGLKMKLETLGQYCRESGILFCVDAIQSLGAHSFDVQAIQADFVMADAHKWLLGPEGIALFFCRADLQENLQLHQYGWHMVEEYGNYERRDWTPARDARRFECGSPNMTGIHALHASLSLIHEVGIESIETQLAVKTDYLIDFLHKRPDLFELITPPAPDRHAGIVSFRPLDRTAVKVFEDLRRQEVLCALRGGGIRFSPHFYTPVHSLGRALACLTD